MRFALPHAKDASGFGKLKVVNTGVRMLEANPTPPSPGQVYRIPQDGALLALPFLSRAVIYVSGAELYTVLRFRGQNVPPATWGPRLHAAMERQPVGCFLLVLAPSLDERTAFAPEVAALAPEARPAYPEPAAAPGFHAVLELEEDGAVARPRARLPPAAQAAIPPPLRVHYAPAPDASGDLIFAPALRSWTGACPLSRMVVSVWKGRGR